MKEHEPQFESYEIEDFTPEEKVLVHKLRSAYNAEMSEGDFRGFRTEMKEEFLSNEARLWAHIKSSTGIAQANCENQLIDYYLRTAALLAAGGFVLDSVELLTEKRKELLEVKRTGSHVFRFQHDFSLLMQRLANAAEVYKERVLPQYTRDVDFETPSLSPEHSPKMGRRSMLQ